MKTALACLTVCLLAGPSALAQSAAQTPEARAAATEAQLTPAERVILTHNRSARPGPGNPLPADAVMGAGYVAGIARLGVPSLKESDASLGVAAAGRTDGATPLPSGVAMAATWDSALIGRGGAMIGAEAKAKGFNVMLAGGINLMRDPRNGRTFEYLGEDPLLNGVLAGAAIAGIQSNHMISTIKHFAFNSQETARKALDARIGDAAARESDLLAFQIAIERGRPGAVMCAYNKVNGPYSCDNDWLLNTVLKTDWAYKGFVMSDWGATPNLQTAMHGLDQQSGPERDPAVFFADPLATAAATDPAYAARLKDMDRRILYAIYANGLDADPPVKKPLDHAADEAVAEQTERAGIVLLRNARGVLPLAATAKTIAVIGGYAANGVLSGGGSAQVQMEGGPAFTLPTGENFHRSVPLTAIRAKLKGANVIYRSGAYISDAVAAAKAADVAIVFATQWEGEGADVPDLSLPNGQDALIEAVAKANPNTVVVLETGSAVLMPWLADTAAVLEAWYPGARGAEAIASVLVGETNPSGRLPITFPASVEQLPRPKLDGLDVVGLGRQAQALAVNYDIEGADVGYRWYARQGLKPLFPFGFGLSYTSFRYSDLKLTSTGANVTVINNGTRAGAEVPQLYLTSAAGKKTLKLAGFDKVELQPGQSRTVVLPFEKRILASWKDGRWTMDGGAYGFAIGHDAETLEPAASITLPAARWN